MKAELLRKLSTPTGIIAALAVDQRRSLRRMLAGGTDEQLSEFKRVVTAALTPYASAVLLDPEYGLDARAARAPQCGLLLTYEMDGFENPRPNRMLALLPDLSARRLRELGADGVKVLLSYNPFDNPRVNDAKHVMIERIGYECEAAGLPFFLEPVGYDPGGMDAGGPEFARYKPDIVIGSMAEFSREIYRVDVLKVEFPVSAAQMFCSRAEALDHFRRADAAARKPYIYLSAGVSLRQFADSIGMATEAGARYSGVLCGRATWKDGAVAYVRGGLAELEEWLATEGVRNIQALNACLESAVPAVAR